jgi:hypothetical protein
MVDDKPLIRLEELGCQRNRRGFRELYGVASATFAEYFDAFVGTLVGAQTAFPTLRVLRTADASVAEPASTPAPHEPVSERINPKLFTQATRDSGTASGRPHVEGGAGVQRRVGADAPSQS